MELHTFMVKVRIRVEKDNNDNITGYPLAYNSFDYQDSYVEVKNCINLYQAVILVKGVYSDRNKYRIDEVESYMLLDTLDFRKKEN